MFEHIDPERHLAVLDLGHAVPETVAFFSRYRCRLCFAGLLEEPALADADPQPIEAALDRLFAGLLRGSGAASFDICLFWDFLNQLELPALRAFGEALRPYVHRDTRAHGFGAFKTTQPLLNQQYGLFDVDSLVVRPRPDDQAVGHAHSRTALARALGCLEITRGTLLREGKMEFLLSGV